MHPFIIESIAAEHVRDRQQAAAHSRDASLARGRHLRGQRQSARTEGTVRLPRPAWFRLHTS